MRDSFNLTSKMRIDQGHKGASESKERQPRAVGDCRNRNANETQAADHARLTHLCIEPNLPMKTLAGLVLGGDLPVLGIFRVLGMWFYSWWTPRTIPELA